MPTRTSSAEWKGDLPSGAGTLVVGDGVFEGNYTFKSRFEEGEGTNPEELIAAAHAACYSMQLSAMLANDGHTADSVKTTAKVHLRNVDGAPTIAQIDLDVVGAGVDADTFREYADKAKGACLITRALAGVKEINLAVSTA